MFALFVNVFLVYSFRRFVYTFRSFASAHVGIFVYLLALFICLFRGLFLRLDKISIEVSIPVLPNASDSCGDGECEWAILDVVVGDRMRGRFRRGFKYTRRLGSPAEQGATEKGNREKKRRTSSFAASSLLFLRAYLMVAKGSFGDA